jgi:hypothetical protein
MSLTFLLTHANALQGSIEFEFLDQEAVSGEELASLRSTSQLDRLAIQRDFASIVAGIRGRTDVLNDGYGLDEPCPIHLLIVSPVTFADGYFLTRHRGIAVLATGAWRTDYFPPTLLEFILTQVVREAAAAAVPAMTRSQHLGTKGCLFDFSATVSEARYKALSSFICAHCREKIEDARGPELVDALLLLNSREWLGAEVDPKSPAAVTHRLGHGLFVTAGAKPSLRERVGDVGLDEAVKFVFLLLGAAVTAWLIGGPK